MKKLFVLFSFLLLTTSAFAVEVKDARVNAETGILEVDVAFGGGCEEHTFELKMGQYCLESFPVQCSAEIVDTSTKPDYCEAYLHRTLRFVLADYNLNDPYFKQAKLRISGANNNKSVTVTLP